MISSLVKVAIFTGLVGALPRSKQHDNNALIVARNICPQEIAFPHWDGATEEKTSSKKKGCVSGCLPWNWKKTKNSDGTNSIQATLSQAKSSKGLCAYDMDEWDGEPAWALVAKAKRGDSRKMYNANLKIMRKLDLVLAETDVGGLPAMVIEKVEGKLFSDTSAWLNLFSKGTRRAPSAESHKDCVEMIDRLHEQVLAKFVQYMETKGLMYDIDAFNYQTSVKWTDGMEDMTFVNWDPVLTRHWPIGLEIPKGFGKNWLYKLGQKDLRAHSGKYTNIVTQEESAIRGWCDYFKRGELSSADSESYADEWSDSEGPSRRQDSPRPTSPGRDVLGELIEDRLHKPLSQVVGADDDGKAPAWVAGTVNRESTANSVASSSISPEVRTSDENDV